MDLDDIMLLKKNIIKIEKIDKTSKESVENWEGDDLALFSINMITHKYSNTKVPLYRFFYNYNRRDNFIQDETMIITRNNHYNITYKCINCGSIHKVALNNIIRKINNNITKCRICKEYDEFKRSQHSIKMLTNYYNKTNNINYESDMLTSNKDIILYEKLESDKKSFDCYDSDFKENYFRRNMDSDEFKYIRTKIISIQNKKFCMTDDFIYYPCVSVSNQTRFCPYLYSKSNNNIEKIVNIEFKCENCGNFFISKGLHTHKNRIKTFCKDCNFTNNIFKIRTFKNLSNESICYQSKFELKFIRYCNENKIVIINGPKIQYTSSNSNRQHTYRLDFAIPKLKLLIEIKDNHIWHKEQVNSGKWQDKVRGVNNFLENKLSYNNIVYEKYIIIFPKNYVCECKNIVDKYWEFSTL
tara:strand:- start:3204 stop:4442 length:1239 start_codon:yes stop_codon:yes gene_type:complete